jgi:hypothetical protein
MDISFDNVTPIDDMRYNLYCLTSNKEEMGSYLFDYGCLVNEGLIRIGNMFRYFGWICLFVLISKLIAYKLAKKYEGTENEEKTFIAWQVIDYVADVMLILNFIFYLWFVQIGVF